MDYMAAQDDPVGSNAPTSNVPPLGIKSNADTPFKIEEFRRISARLQTHNVEEGETDVEMWEGDSEESYTAIWSVVPCQQLRPKRQGKLQEWMSCGKDS